MTKIYVTGDTHGLNNIKKIHDFLNTIDGNSLTKNDYMIVLGDFGVCWYGNRNLETQRKMEKQLDEEINNIRNMPSAKALSDDDFEFYRQVKLFEIDQKLSHDESVRDFWDNMPWTTLFIDGNHENHELLDSYLIEEWNGGKIHKISDSIYHLLRGQVFNIDGITLFTMGGAESIDKKYRKEGVSWWSREMPSEEEYKEAVNNLNKHNRTVDCVLTHCAPEDYLNKRKMNGMNYHSSNELEKFFDIIAGSPSIKYKGWYFGHYHDDVDQGEFHMLYDRVIELTKSDNQF